jgi:hypothetical protein
MVLPFRVSQKITEARASVIPLERRDDIPRVLSGHHPKTSFSFDGNYVRRSDQMTIFEESIGLSPDVIEHDTYASTRCNEDTTEIRGNRLRKAMCLGSDQPLQVKI